MPRLDYVRCLNCRRHSSEVGPLSHTRLCGDCARVLYVENMDALKYKRGPGWNRYVAGMGRYIDTLRAPHPHTRSA